MTRNKISHMTRKYVRFLENVIGDGCFNYELVNSALFIYLTVFDFFFTVV